MDGQLRESARLGRIGKGNKILLDKKGIEETISLLKRFLESRPQPITSPRDLSERAAKLAHIIRDIIVEAFEKEKASQDLKDLREAFAEVSPSAFSIFTSFRGQRAFPKANDTERVAIIY